MAKMKCKECGKTIDDNKKICPNCGFKNKIDFKVYTSVNNNKQCIKCGQKLNKDDNFCTNCGYKRDNKYIDLKKYMELFKTIFKRNKKVIIICSILIIIFFGFVIENHNFNRDIILAENYYDNKEFDKVSKIVDKYSFFHKNNEFIKKYTYIESMLYDYQFASIGSSYPGDKDKLESLFDGYEYTLTKDTTNEWENDLVDEVRDIYYSGINKIITLKKSEIEKICSMEKAERTQKINELIRQEEKKNTCNKVNVRVVDYSKSGYKIDVTLKNNNGCTWNIKSYSEVRVYFTDNSYEDVYLSTNINLKSDEKYTFYDCYLGSDNEYKRVKSVTFID